MKAIYFHAAGAIALTFAIAACVPKVDPIVSAPPPVTAPSPTPTPTPTPPPVVQEPEFDNYLDAPQTPGNWTYLDEPGETLALFGPSAAEPVLMIRCGKTNREIGIARIMSAPAGSPRMMRIETETAERQIQASPIESRPSLMVARFDPRDPLLDAMAITKGRFAVGVEGERTLYIPAWVEVSRVIEDCR